MLSRVLIFVALCAACAACGGPVQGRASPSGELIAFGGGPGGPLDACFTCHGFNGEGLDASEQIGNGSAAAPRLAGLDAGYLAKQLFDYAKGRRADSTMAPIARRLTDRDMRAVAAYYAEMEGPAPPDHAPPALYVSGDPARGLRACSDCHARDALGLPPNNPALAGQPAAYTREQLRRWRAGVRRNDPGGVMAAASRALTDEEAEALARYLAGESPL